MFTPDECIARNGRVNEPTCGAAATRETHIGRVIAFEVWNNRSIGRAIARLFFQSFWTG